MQQFLWPIVLCLTLSGTTAALSVMWLRKGRSASSGTPSRMPAVVESIALFWLFAAAWFAMNLGALAINFLQREKSTFQGQLVCSEPRLEIGAGWWRTHEPLQPPSDAIAMQGMRFGGKLAQLRGPQGPTSWQLEGRSEARGDGAVTEEAIRLFVSHAGIDPNDPLMTARIADLRTILLGGKSLAPPSGSDWRLVRPFGPYTDVESSGLVIVSTAALSVGGWIVVSMWRLVRQRRRSATTADTVRSIVRGSTPSG